MKQPERYAGSHVWTTSAGTGINVVNMTRSHIENTLALLVKKVMLQDFDSVEDNVRMTRENRRVTERNKKLFYDKWIKIFTAELEWRELDAMRGLDDGPNRMG